MSAPAPDTDPGTVTRLLAEARRGDPEAFDRLVPLVYASLKEVSRAVRRGRPGAMLSTTELVHESYLKLGGGETVPWKNRGHFLAVAARAMRQVLVDEARRRVAGKRGGGELPLTLTDVEGRPSLDPLEVLALDRALEELEALNPRLRLVVELRYFAGLQNDEIAEELDVSSRTVERDWVKARLFLRSAMTGPEPDGEA